MSKHNTLDNTTERLTPFFAAIEMSLLPTFADHQIRFGNKDNWIVLQKVLRTGTILVPLISFQNYRCLRKIFQALIEYTDNVGVAIQITDHSNRDDLGLDYDSVIALCSRNGFRQLDTESYTRLPIRGWMFEAIYRSENYQ